MSLSQVGATGVSAFGGASQLLQPLPYGEPVVLHTNAVPDTASGVAAKQIQLPPFVYEAAKTVKEGSGSDSFLLSLAVVGEKLYAAVWDKAKLCPVLIPLFPVTTGPSSEAKPKVGLNLSVSLEKGAAIRKWLRKQSAKRLLGGPPTSVVLGAPLPHPGEEVVGKAPSGKDEDESHKWLFRPSGYLGLVSLQDPRLPPTLPHFNLTELHLPSQRTSSSSHILGSSSITSSSSSQNPPRPPPCLGLESWQEAGSGVYTVLTCSAMNEDDGVPFMDHQTKVPVLPEATLALLLAHAARQVAKPGKGGSSGEKDVLTLPSSVYLVSPPGCGLRVRQSLAASARCGGLAVARILPHSLAALLGALVREGQTRDLKSGDGSKARLSQSLLAQMEEKKSSESNVLVVHMTGSEMEVALVRCSDFDRKLASKGTCPFAGGFKAFSVVECCGDSHMGWMSPSALETCAALAVNSVLTSASETAASSTTSASSLPPVAAALLYINHPACQDKLRQTVMASLHPKVVVVDGVEGDGALGGSLVAAADSQQFKGFLPTLQVTDALPFSLALHSQTKSVELLLPRMSALPCSFSRVFEMKKEKNEPCTLTEQLSQLYSSTSSDLRKNVGQSKQSASSKSASALHSVIREGDSAWMAAELESVCPLRVWEDEEEGDESWLEVEHATLQVEVDRDGILSTYISDRGPKTAESKEAVKRKKWQKQMFRTVFTVALLIMMLVAPMGYMLYDQYRVSRAAAAKHEEYVLRLERYYSEVAPDKLEEGGRASLETTLAKYKDREHILWRRLESKYGVFPKVLSKGSTKSSSTNQKAQTKEPTAEL